jgi:hypothetical protein
MSVALSPYRVVVKPAGSKVKLSRLVFARNKTYAMRMVQAYPGDDLSASLDASSPRAM